MLGVLGKAKPQPGNNPTIYIECTYGVYEETIIFYSNLSFSIAKKAQK
jgi:hypothetical protein